MKLLVRTLTDCGMLISGVFVFVAIAVLLKKPPAVPVRASCVSAGSCAPACAEATGAGCGAAGRRNRGAIRSTMRLALVFSLRRRRVGAEHGTSADPQSKHAIVKRRLARSELAGRPTLPRLLRRRSPR